MRVVKTAAVQLSPVPYSREGTIDKVVQKIHELGQQAVQFATFPETVVPHYPYFSFIQPAYQIIGGCEHLKLLDQPVSTSSRASRPLRSKTVCVPRRLRTRFACCSRRPTSAPA